MKISVIIPTYKPKDYLWECLESLVKQTFPLKDFEIILVLNGCSDPWKSEIEFFISKEMKGMNVNFIYTEQIGVSNARNIGLRKSKGEYICFIDDDDLISPNYLEALYNIAAPDIIPLCKPLSFIDNIYESTPYYITNDYDKYYKYDKLPYYKPRRFFNGPVYKLIHKSVISGREFDVKFKNGEDSLFMFLCSDNFKWVKFTDNTCVYYRRFREDSATSRKRSLCTRFSNEFSRMAVMCSIYMKNIRRYNFRYFIRGLIGCCAAAIKG